MKPECYLYKHKLTSTPFEGTCIKLQFLGMMKLKQRCFFFCYKKTFQGADFLYCMSSIFVAYI